MPHTLLYTTHSPVYTTPPLYTTHTPLCYTPPLCHTPPSIPHIAPSIPHHPCIPHTPIYTTHPLYATHLPLYHSPPICHTPSPREQTDACENITFRHTTYEVGKNRNEKLTISARTLIIFFVHYHLNNAWHNRSSCLSLTRRTYFAITASNVCTVMFIFS